MIKSLYILNYFKNNCKISEIWCKSVKMKESQHLMGKCILGEKLNFSLKVRKHAQKLLLKQLFKSGVSKLLKATYGDTKQLKTPY